MIGALVVAAIAFVVAVGNPVDWLGQRVDQFQTQGNPSFEGSSSRFTFDTGTERQDLWGVALRTSAAIPCSGTAEAATSTATRRTAEHGAERT